MMFVIFVIASVIITATGDEDCGTVTTGSSELPWQAGIYKHLRSSDGQPLLNWFCGATLVSNKAVLTVAHKLFSRLSQVRPLSPQGFSAGVGEQPYPWRPTVDISTQFSQVSSIHLAPGFQHRGSGNNVEYYADDVAVVIVEKPFILTSSIRPICLNFDYKFEQDQLKNGAMGKAQGWLYDYYDEEETKPAYYLQVKGLYHVPLNDCLDESVTEHLDIDSVKILTLAVSDKICFNAKQNISAPCNYEEDDGSGVAFPAVVNGTQRYFLRGILSGPLDVANDCTILTYYMFTSPLKHESFIKRYVNVEMDKPADTGKCVLPPYPEHGTYVINTTSSTTGGKTYDLETLTVSCQPGYGVLGSASIKCFKGLWLHNFPKCVRNCLLKPHPSVEYQCLVDGGGIRPCEEYEPPRTLVRPRCRSPHYYSASPLPFMSCSENGYWDYTARCSPECGRVTPEGMELVARGVPARRGELPWHAGIYKTTYKPYLQICGGSLISNNLIISAAHCFWSDLEKQLPAEQFAVAVGKLYRPWDDAADDAQKSAVKEIHLPPRFQGAGSNFQDDIAVVVTKDAFEFKTFIRPVCLSFDVNFERHQLQTTNSGKVAGWGLTSENGKPSSVLQVADLAFVDIGVCIVDSPPAFREYITSDKICAGSSAQRSSAALCRGDSGGGLAFPAHDRGVERFYLRGVVSTAPNNDHACNTAAFTSFTQVLKHEEFIKQLLTD